MLSHVQLKTRAISQDKFSCFGLELLLPFYLEDKHVCRKRRILRLKDQNIYLERRSFHWKTLLYALAKDFMTLKQKFISCDINLRSSVYYPEDIYVWREFYFLNTIVNILRDDFLTSIRKFVSWDMNLIFC